MMRRVALAAAGALLAAALLGGCDATRDALATSPSTRCFEALPAARSVVHGAGRFAGVRYATVAALSRTFAGLAPGFAGLARLDPRAGRGFCVVAFAGRLRPEGLGAVRTFGDGPGRLVLVVVPVTGGRPVASVVVARPSLRLARLDLARLDLAG